MLNSEKNKLESLFESGVTFFSRRLLNGPDESGQGTGKKIERIFRLYDLLVKEAEWRHELSSKVIKG